MGGQQLRHCWAKGIAYSDCERCTTNKRTKREKFLARMDDVVPWKPLLNLIESHYPSKGGRPAYPLETMLRIQLLQHWYSLSDPAMEKMLVEKPLFRRFSGINLMTDWIPGVTTIMTFRLLLEKIHLADQIFQTVNCHLTARCQSMRQGIIVDATIIDVPSSTKNKTGERDPEMHQTKKANQWYFGMKVHIGVDSDSGLIHSVVTTPANVHDLTTAA